MLYNITGGILYTISKDGVGNDQISRGYTLDGNTGNVLQSWRPNREVNAILMLF